MGRRDYTSSVTAVLHGQSAPLLWTRSLVIGLVFCLSAAPSILHAQSGTPPPHAGILAYYSWGVENEAGINRLATAPPEVLIGDGPLLTKGGNDYWNDWTIAALTYEINTLKPLGTKVLGYIDTCGFNTWCASAGRNPRPVSVVKAAVDKIMSLGADGIMLDEAGVVRNYGDSDYLYLQEIYNYVKTTYGSGKIVMANPGWSQIGEAYMDIIDIVSLEQDWKNFNPSWKSKYDPKRFYGVDNGYAGTLVTDLATAVSETQTAHDFGIGYFYATDKRHYGSVYTWWVNWMTHPGLSTSGSGNPPGAASNPSPTDGGTSVPLNATLSWTAGTGATSYDVYFGTTAAPPLVTTVNATSYSPGTLASSSTYYWKVAARNAAGSAGSATWSFTTAAASGTPSPLRFSANPSSGAALSQTFTFVYSDAGGYANLAVGSVLFGTDGTGANACWLQYDRDGNALWLARDDGAYWDSLMPGAFGTLQNSQCTINGRGVSASGSGNDLTLKAAITFKTAFAGTKNIYMRAKRQSGLVSDSVISGTWTVPVARVVPERFREP